MHDKLLLYAPATALQKRVLKWRRAITQREWQCGKSTFMATTPSNSTLQGRPES